MNDDVIINKMEIIARCLSRVNEEYQAAGSNFSADFTRQDAAILNLERASQGAIDIAAHIVRVKRLSLPKKTRDLFDALFDGNIISEESRNSMISMVGFRNITVHEYQKLNVQIVESIIKNRLVDFEKFMQEILEAK